MTRTPDYFAMLSANVEGHTLDQASHAVENAAANGPFIEQTIKSLVGAERGRNVLIVSGGPSLARRDSIARVKKMADNLVIVAADGALGHCLRAGLTPDYVVSLDPHATRIVRWFGDRSLDAERLSSDDYFRRQELDDAFNRDELRINQEQIRLVDAAGPKMKIALCTSAPAAVRQRCIESGMDIYWWNAILDDVSDEDSVTRRLYKSNRVPCMNAGGNVGTAATVLAARVLQARRVIMIGMDFAYYADTPIDRTQYYDLFRDFMDPADIPSAFKTYRNPHLDQDFYTDPAYNWYREGLLELAKTFPECELINATEGGILFGEGIDWMTLEQVSGLIES